MLCAVPSPVFVASACRGILVVAVLSGCHLDAPPPPPSRVEGSDLGCKNCVCCGCKSWLVGGMIHPPVPAALDMVTPPGPADCEFELNTLAPTGNNSEADTTLPVNPLNQFGKPTPPFECTCRSLQISSSSQFLSQKHDASAAWAQCGLSVTTNEVGPPCTAGCHPLCCCWLHRPHIACVAQAPAPSIAGQQQAACGGLGKVSKSSCQCSISSGCCARPSRLSGPGPSTRRAAATAAGTAVV